ncbi:MAG: paraquat-inducible protein A [Caldimonas sp.]
MVRAEDALVVCERCDQAFRWSLLRPGAIARCTRCEAILGRGHRLRIETVLALTVTALIVFLVAAFADVISIRLGSTTVAASMPDAVVWAWRDDERLVSITAAITALVAPALYIGLRLYVLLPIALVGRAPPGFGTCVRVLHEVSKWNMVEVLTVGGLLSLVRLAGLAEATPGPGMFALGLLTILFAAIESAGLRHLWAYAT